MYGKNLEYLNLKKRCRSFNHDTNVGIGQHLLENYTYNNITMIIIGSVEQHTINVTWKHDIEFGKYEMFLFQFCDVSKVAITH